MNSNSKISEIETHPIIMEDGSSHTKDLSQKKGKKRSISKNKLKQSKEKPLKRMKTRSDTKVDKDSEPPTYGIMNLVLASLSS